VLVLRLITIEVGMTSWAGLQNLVVAVIIIIAQHGPLIRLRLGIGRRCWLVRLRLVIGGSHRLIRPRLAIRWHPWLVTVGLGRRRVMRTALRCRVHRTQDHADHAFGNRRRLKGVDLGARRVGDYTSQDERQNSRAQPYFPHCISLLLARPGRNCGSGHDCCMV
jgi:hypothetical protein